MSVTTYINALAVRVLGWLKLCYCRNGQLPVVIILVELQSVVAFISTTTVQKTPLTD